MTRLTIKILQLEMKGLRSKLKQAENKNSELNRHGISEPLLIQHLKTYILQYIRIHNEQVTAIEQEINTTQIKVSDLRAYIAERAEEDK